VAGAQHGLDALVERMPRFLEHARAIGGALSELPGIDVVPDPPQTPLFHLHLRGDADTLVRRALSLAREERIWLFHKLAPTSTPGVQKLELNLGEPALEIDAAEAAELFARVLGG
jgi:hypothetical protein